MTENSYCCYGLETCCWQELVEEGIWDLSLEQVKKNIIYNIRHARKYLYNTKKYGKRFYIYEDEEVCLIYIYLRDMKKEDYAIWFSNEER